MQDLESLVTTGNWIQIFAIVLIFLGGVLQISKFVIDKKIKTIKNANEISEKEEHEKKVAGLELELKTQTKQTDIRVGVLDSSLGIQEKKTNDLSQTLKKRNEKLKDLEARVSIINSLEVHLFIDELTNERPVGEISNNMGWSSAIAFFTDKNERYRFVTDFTFSNQQITPHINRGILKFKPENPSQILGKSISLLENFEKLGYDFSDFVKYFGFEKSNKMHLISMKLYLNGTEVMNLRNIPHENGVIYDGKLSLDLKKAFIELEKKYQDIINLESID